MNSYKQQTDKNKIKGDSSTLIQCYMPPNNSDEKKEFKNSIFSSKKKWKKYPNITVMGDLNAKVGTDIIYYERFHGKVVAEQ